MHTTRLLRDINNTPKHCACGHKPHGVLSGGIRRVMRIVFILVSARPEGAGKRQETPAVKAEGIGTEIIRVLQ